MKTARPALPQLVVFWGLACEMQPWSSVVPFLRVGTRMEAKVQSPGEWWRWHLCCLSSPGEWKERGQRQKADSGAGGGTPRTWGEGWGWPGAAGARKGERVRKRRWIWRERVTEETGQRDGQARACTRAHRRPADGVARGPGEHEGGWEQPWRPGYSPLTRLAREAPVGVTVLSWSLAGL